jgi:hypothetical protein
MAENSELLQRRAFEMWITVSPYELSIGRWPLDETKYAWPGHYRDPTVQLAWEAWCESAQLITGSAPPVPPP